MREDLRPLIETLMEGIPTQERMVRDLLFAAHTAENPLSAEVLRGIARRHRVKILEMRGQLAAVAELYVTGVRREV